MLPKRTDAPMKLRPVIVTVLPPATGPPRGVTALTAGRAGEVRVRAVYWIAYEPSFTDELAWQPAGTPAPPQRALWFERFEIGKTVRAD